MTARQYCTRGHSSFKLRGSSVWPVFEAIARQQPDTASVAALYGGQRQVVFACPRPATIETGLALIMLDVRR